MNRSFSKAITSLRKERNLSQKQVSQELGISQALLSHYEKGIRECSLDFVCRIADYYDVSTDYLLGRSRDRYPFDPKENAAPVSTGLTPNARLQINTLSVIYQTLGKLSNRRLTRNISQLLMLVEYRLLRALYQNSVGDEMLFSSDRAHYRGYTLSAVIKLFSDIEAQCDMLKENKLLRTDITADEFSDEYPDESGAALNMISHAETIINKIK